MCSKYRHECDVSRDILYNVELYEKVHKQAYMFFGKSYSYPTRKYSVDLFQQQIE